MAVACLLAGAQTVRLAAAITLAWTHSVQKSAWQEDWRASSDGLVLAEVRVEGSGAGMEPPDDAVLKGGFYVAHPALAPQRQVILRRSGATADWQICITGACRPMAELVPPDADPVTLTTCE